MNLACGLSRTRVIGRGGGAGSVTSPGRTRRDHGDEAGSVTLSGRRVPNESPRVCSGCGTGELPRAIYVPFADHDALAGAVLGAASQAWVRAARVPQMGGSRPVVAAPSRSPITAGESCRMPAPHLRVLGLLIALSLAGSPAVADARWSRPVTIAASAYNVDGALSDDGTATALWASRRKGATGAILDDGVELRTRRARSGRLTPTRRVASRWNGLPKRVTPLGGGRSLVVFTGTGGETIGIQSFSRAGTPGIRRTLQGSLLTTDAMYIASDPRGGAVLAYRGANESVYAVRVSRSGTARPPVKISARSGNVMIVGLSRGGIATILWDDDGGLHLRRLSDAGGLGDVVDVSPPGERIPSVDFTRMGVAPDGAAIVLWSRYTYRSDADEHAQLVSRSVAADGRIGDIVNLEPPRDVDHPTEGFPVGLSAGRALVYLREPRRLRALELLPDGRLGTPRTIFRGVTDAPYMSASGARSVIAWRTRDSRILVASANGTRVGRVQLAAWRDPTLPGVNNLHAVVNAKGQVAVFYDAYDARNSPAAVRLILGP